MPETTGGSPGRRTRSRRMTRARRPRRWPVGGSGPGSTMPGTTNWSSGPRRSLRAWLVSDPDPSAVSEDEPTLASASGEMVELVGPRTVGERDEDQVEAPKVGVSGKRAASRAPRLVDRRPGIEGDAGHAAGRGGQGSRGSARASPGGAESCGAAGDRPATANRSAISTGPTPGSTRSTDWPQASFLATDRDEPEGALPRPRHPHQRAAGGCAGGRLPARPVDGTRAHQRAAEHDAALHGERREGDQLRGACRPTTSSTRNSSSVSGNLHHRRQRSRGGRMGFELGANPAACIADESFHFKMPAIVSLQVAFSLQARPHRQRPGSAQPPLPRARSDPHLLEPARRAGGDPAKRLDDASTSSSSPTRSM